MSGKALLSAGLLVLTLGSFFVARIALSESSSKLSESASKPLVMAVAQSESQYYGRLASLIYQEAFRRLGREIEVRHYPLKRENSMLKRGEIDGDLGRTELFLRDHPELIKVQEAPIKIRIVAFTHNPELKIESWDALRTANLRVDYLRGSSFAEQRLKSGVIQGEFNAVDDWTMGVRKLVAKRSDVFVEFEGAVRMVMDQGEFRDKKIYPAGALEEFDLHAFLRPEHRQLALQLSEVLLQMRREGLIAAYEQEAFFKGIAVDMSGER